MKTELSDGEWTLMKALWKGAPMTITQLTGALRDGPGWSKHTIISMLSRLEEKRRSPISITAEPKPTFLSWNREALPDRRRPISWTRSAMAAWASCLTP